jgi:ribulose-phosphate 3-epimerase
MPVRISASLAAAPLGHLEQTIDELGQAGVDSIHFDIEDGSFVPAMTLGTKIISDLRPHTRLPFDVHLMMANPEWLIPELAQMGANRISVHYEACPYPRRVLRQVASSGISAGLAFNPATPLPDLAYLRPYLSFILVLTSEPEMPDMPFLPEILEKVRQGRNTDGLAGIEWVVDGGLNSGNIARVASTGAENVVVGRAVFQDGKIRDNLRALRQAAG